MGLMELGSLGEGSVCFVCVKREYIPVLKQTFCVRQVTKGE